jgi:hypothetical protein
MKLLTLTALMAVSASAYAEIYQCVDGDSVAFSDRPCAPVYHQQPVVGPAVSAEVPASSPPVMMTVVAEPEDTLHRSQLEARVRAASRRLELLRRERGEALAAFSARDSMDAQVMNHHYSGIIEPLERELADMRARLDGSSAL